ncbi:MAG: SpoIIE family protein phosphatase [Treponema sp.]|nr:SpoIIE family protein phosphatase [Treponema sp.]
MTVEFETEKVNKSIAEFRRGAIWFATGGQIAYDAQSQTLGETTVVEFLRSFPAAVGGGFWFAPFAYNKDTYRAGSYAFFDQEIGEVRLDDTFFMDEYDYHNLSWYIEIAENAKEPYQVVWTKPYVDDSGSYALMTTAGAAIFDEKGALVAMSTVDWAIDEVIANLSAIKPTAGSFILLYVPEKDYIIANTQATNGAGMSLSIIPWDINADTFELNGVKYMTFNRVMDNGWVLSVQIPTNEIFEELESRNNRFSIIIALLVILSLRLAFFLITKLVNTPLKRLTDDAVKIGQGEFDCMLDLHTGDEIETLANTINKMVADIKHITGEKERIGSELRIATDIQADMLPKIFAPYSNRDDMHISALMQPAKEVGGDFYDFFFIDDAQTKIALIIADVSGKGVPAALFMVIAKVLIKNNKDLPPDEVLRIVNNLLCSDNNSTMFVTTYYSVLDIPTGKYTYASAGHNPPILYRNQSNTNEYLNLPPKTPPLGILPNKKFISQELKLERGDTLLLYTDGITEAFNTRSEMYGSELLLENAKKFAELPAEATINSLYETVKTFADGEPQSDDITMLYCKYFGLP